MDLYSADNPPEHWDIGALLDEQENLEAAIEGLKAELADLTAKLRRINRVLYGRRCGDVATDGPALAE